MVNQTNKTSQTVESKVSARIYGKGRGWVFSQKDFMDLAGTSTIHWALYELAQAGTTRRVLRGIYDYPRFSELVNNQMPPNIHQVANALSRKFGWRIQPNGSAALNLLDLSTQVPGKFLYYSDGPSRDYQIGKTPLVFKHQALKDAVRDYETAVLIQGLKELGPDRINDDIVHTMRDWLSVKKRKGVLKEARGATVWVYEVLKKICKEGP